MTQRPKMVVPFHKVENALKLSQCVAWCLVRCVLQAGILLMTRGRFVQGLFGEIVIYGMLPLIKRW